jgi:hypothetical protein
VTRIKKTSEVRGFHSGKYDDDDDDDDDNDDEK